LPYHEGKEAAFLAGQHGRPASKRSLREGSSAEKTLSAEPLKSTPEETAANKITYKALQKQRRLERNLRRAKRERTVAGTPKEAKRAINKVKTAREKLLEHIDANKLSRKPKRESIGKTRYGDTAEIHSAEFMTKRAIAAYERQTGIAAPVGFLGQVTPEVKGLKNYTELKEEVFRRLKYRSNQRTRS
jgi:hypothetical protein